VTVFLIVGLGVLIMERETHIEQHGRTWGDRVLLLIYTPVLAS